MKILQVIHDYLPRHRAGSEIYTHLLSKALIGRGHDVRVVYAEYDPARFEYSIRRGAFDGVPVIEVVFNYGVTRFAERYANPRMDALFARLLDETRPDLVHFEHLEHFSIGCIGAAKRRGLPVVFTLHEYCLTCPRKGIRMMADLSLCETLEADRCAVCIERENVFEPTLSMRLESWAKRAVPPRARRFVRKRLASVGLARHPDLPPLPAPPAAPVDRSAHARAIESRWDAVRRACAGVDLFIAPSPFLRTKFVEFGVPERKILFSDNGIDVAPFRGLERAPSDRVRFGYVGTLDEHKGVHVLAEAMNRLPRGAAALSIHGDPAAFPAYAERLRAIASGSPDTRFAGPFDPARVASVFAGIDVLVVPSIWFENSPLTIHEAFAANVPVVATGIGGMKDLVRDGVSGLLFRRGDAADLARTLERFVDEPALLDRLRAGLPRVKTVEEDAADMEARYRRLLGDRPPGAARP